MEASTVPRAAPGGVSVKRSQPLLRLTSDARLVTLIREGNIFAFEGVYDRHHRAILAFCRHMLDDAQEAEDAVQHTFLAAYNDLISSEKEIQLRAWLFAIARNRCCSILRQRREHPAAELGEPATEGLAVQVQRRQDLRDLVLDMRRLPHDQRAALVLAELDALSHEQIGEALGVPREKVKALVFQARESLIASRTARDTDCAVIRAQLATLRGGELRRGNLRRHLRGCAACRDFRRQVERQRRQLAVLLPVAPAFGLKETVLGTVMGGGSGSAAGGGAGILASGVVAGATVKAAAVVVAALGAAGTLIAAGGIHPSAAGSARSQPSPHPVAAVVARRAQADPINFGGPLAAVAGATSQPRDPGSSRWTGAAAASESAPDVVSAYGLAGNPTSASAVAAGPLLVGAPVRVSSHLPARLAVGSRAPVSRGKRQSEAGHPSRAPAGHSPSTRAAPAGGVGPNGGSSRASGAASDPRPASASTGGRPSSPNAGTATGSAPAAGNAAGGAASTSTSAGAPTP